MSIKLGDVLRVNLALAGVRLLSTPTERDSFRRSVDTEVLESGPDIASNLTSDSPPQTLAIERDRITFTLTNDMSFIARDYPSSNDLERLGDVAQLAIDTTDLQAQQPRAFGFNSEAVYDLSTGQTASNFIATHVFSSNLFQEMGYKIVGSGAITLHARRDGHLWTIYIAPRFDDTTTNKLFVALHLYNIDNKLPSRHVIKHSLQDVWSNAHTIMDSFDRTL